MNVEDRCPDAFVGGFAPKFPWSATFGTCSEEEQREQHALLVNVRTALGDILKQEREKSEQQRLKRERERDEVEPASKRQRMGERTVIQPTPNGDAVQLPVLLRCVKRKYRPLAFYAVMMKIQAEILKTTTKNERRVEAKVELFFLGARRPSFIGAKHVSAEDQEFLLACLALLRTHPEQVFDRVGTSLTDNFGPNGRTIRTASTSFVGFTNYSIEGHGATKLREFILEGGQFVVANAPDMADLVPFVKSQMGECVGQWSEASERLHRLVTLHRLADKGGDFDLSSSWYREVKPIGRDLPGHGNEAPRSLVKSTDKSAFPASKPRERKKNKLLLHEAKRVPVQELDGLQIHELVDKNQMDANQMDENQMDKNQTKPLDVQTLSQGADVRKQQHTSSLMNLMRLADEAAVASLTGTRSTAERPPNMVVAAAHRAVSEAKKMAAASGGLSSAYLGAHQRDAPPKVTRCINRKLPVDSPSSVDSHTLPTQPKALLVKLPTDVALARSCLSRTRVLVPRLNVLSRATVPMSLD